MLLDDLSRAGEADAGALEAALDIGAALEALEELLKVAGAQGQSELVTFAETLLNHARLEEEVLYPAAIVAGEYLKIRLAERAAVAAL